ncbi:MAG: hypothetical protein GF315_10230 [candidate division Zixibacteria bacterium]|nr:hypothetical protein [candidate division Zixibacteria bacterium]
MNTQRLLRIALLVFMFASFVFFIFKEIERDKQSEASNTEIEEVAPYKLVAYYFHSNVRCPSCIKIENYSQEAILTNFRSEIDAGLVEWRMVNTDEPENTHYIGDYNLFTKSVVIVEYKDGEQVRWKNLEKVWELLDDKQAFQDYVSGEIKQYLEQS